MAYAVGGELDGRKGGQVSRIKEKERHMEDGNPPHSHAHIRSVCWLLRVDVTGFPSY